jgi:hypothetical protein
MWILFILSLLFSGALLGQIDARFISPEARVIASVDVPKLLASAAGPEVRNWVVESFDACPLAESVFVNMRRLQFSAGRPSAESRKRTPWLIVLDGVWDWPAVQSCVAQAGLEPATHRGLPMMLPANRRSGASSLAFFGGEFILIGEEQPVRDAIDRAMDNPAAESDLLRHAGAINSEWDHWVVGEGSPLEFNRNTRPDLLQEIPESRSYWLGISGAETYNVSLRLEMMSAEEAALVMRIFSWIPAIARLRPAERSLQSDLMRHVEIRANGALVTISADVPGSALWAHISQLTAGPIARSRFSRQGAARRER